MFRNTFYLGKVFGIPLRVHLSWLIIFVLITWSMAAHYYPSRYEGWPRQQYWIVGIVAALLFFASVLVHELAHSVLARSRGLKVRDIVLFIFGGVSEIAEESKTPGTEFLIAAVGPATSILLGVLLLGVAHVVGDASPPVTAVASHLGLINVILAAFNLIPGFPLDGGRVLRAILWKISGQMDRATRWAARAGQAVAYLFILVGLFWFFTQHEFVGLWFAFIGWFLENAALSSYRQVLLKHSLSGHTVDEVMMRDYPAVAPDEPLGLLVNDFFLPLGLRSLPVVADERVAGLVTLHDINQVPRDDWMARRAGDVMVPIEETKTTTPDENLWEALVRMTSEEVNQLPVVSEGRLEGMLTRAGILTFLRMRAELGL